MNVSIGKIAATALELSNLDDVTIVRVTKRTVVLDVTLYSLRGLELRASRLASDMDTSRPRHITDALERAATRLRNYVLQAEFEKQQRESCVLEETKS